MRNDRDFAQAPSAFPQTQWSLVERAGQQANPQEQRRALEALLKRYLPALRAHLIEVRRIPSDRADDLLQGFIADKVIEQNLLERAQKERGRLRNFVVVTRRQ
jgi:hypothetical protein